MPIEKAKINIDTADSDIKLAASAYEKKDFRDCCMWIDMAIVELMNAYARIKKDNNIQ
jgi:hypothetical protein